MDTIYLDDFLTEGMLKEIDFRKKVDSIDWKIYKNKKVMIKGCSSVPVPIWSYLIITANLIDHAKQVFYGESCSAIKIFER